MIIFVSVVVLSSGAFEAVYSQDDGGQKVRKDQDSSDDDDTPAIDDEGEPDERELRDLDPWFLDIPEPADKDKDKGGEKDKKDEGKEREKQDELLPDNLE
jgi:hypothetical protein